VTFYHDLENDFCTTLVRMILLKDIKVI